MACGVLLIVSRLFGICDLGQPLRVPDIDAAIELVNGTEFGSSPSLSRRSGCRTAATLTRDAGRAEPEHRPAGVPAQPPRDEDLPAEAEHGRPGAPAAVGFLAC
jgi:hypothetical protein